MTETAPRADAIPLLHANGIGFHDRNRNGRLDPFEDPRLPVEDRVDDLLGQMTLEQKAGLMFYASITPEENDPSAEQRHRITEKMITHFGLLAISDMREMAAWQNRLQDIAAEAPLGIPLTFASDPRHAFSTNPYASWGAAGMSQWPEPIGLAAIGDEELTERFGDIARREYLAAGLRVALHPMADLATEPRWTRTNGTFGEDAELASRILAAYVRGFQGGPQLRSDGVATMVKHFPGGGPQKDGEDAHFEYGKEQVYPGGNFDYHVRPFEAAFAAGASQVMPYYGVPMGTEYEEIGFGFNRSVITGLLRERLGFDGIVCTDWCLLSDIASGSYPARAWGAEHLSTEERLVLILDAGCDQVGGESCPELLVELVHSGRVTEERIDVSARRILREKFVLGLFEDPYVQIDDAATIIGRADFVQEGLAAQRAAHTLLKNDTPAGAERPLLPLPEGSKAFVVGIDPSVAAEYVTVAQSVDEADCAIVRLAAPYEKRAGAIEQYFHAGSLDFDAETLEMLLPILERLPTIVVVHLERPAILTPIATAATALVGEFGASDVAVLDVVTGRGQPRGKLPFDLPSSMDEVAAQRSDVPFDTPNPLYRFGHGLAYDASGVD